MKKTTSSLVVSSKTVVLSVLTAIGEVLELFVPRRLTARIAQAVVITVALLPVAYVLGNILANVVASKLIFALGIV